MKILILTLCATLAIEQSFAQEYITSLGGNNSNNKLSIMIEGGAIEVLGYAGNELVINADGYEAPPEKAKGLRPLYANNQEDNSGIGLSVIKEGNVVKITSVGHQEIDYFIKVPDQSSLQISAGPRNDELAIKNMNGEVEVKAHSDDVDMEGISGPVVANSISGNINLSYARLNFNKPIAISVISGDVDMILPPDTKADFKLSSISGEVYTDFDIQMNQKNGGEDEQFGMRRPINGSINGGGIPIHITTVSGNIYLRKK